MFVATCVFLTCVVLPMIVVTMLGTGKLLDLIFGSTDEQRWMD